MTQQSEKISLVAKLSIEEEKVADVAACLDGLIAAADEEPGLLIYSAHVDSADPSTVYFFELYENQAALDVHGKGEMMRPAMKALGGLLKGRPEVTLMSPQAAKGLEL